jgi:hypothetical protein
MAVTVVDAPITTADAYPAAITVSGAATGLIVAVGHSVGFGDASGPSSVSMGGQSLTQIGVAEGAASSGHDVSLSFWALNETKIAAASNTTLSFSGGNQTGIATAYFTVAGSVDVETLSASGNISTATTGSVSLARSAGSLTFACSLHDNASFGFSNLSNPAEDNEITATNIDFVYGVEADTARTVDFTWDNASSRNNSTLALNISEGASPSGPSLDTVPSTAYPGQSRTVSGSGFGATQGTGGLTIGGVSQTITSWSDASITFTTVLGANSYGTGKVVELTTDAGGTDTGAVELVADTAGGFGVVTMSSPNTTDESSVAYQTTATVATGDQFEWEDYVPLGNLSVDAQGFVTVDTEGQFRGRFWDATDQTWGPVETFTASLPDTTAPTITSVDVPTAGSYKAGGVLTFTSNFSESVDVTGTPAINFSVNGSPRQANYSSGTGSSALVFTYTVQNGDDTNGLSVTSLSLDGGTIADTAGNAADLTLVSVGDASGIIIDTVAPTVGVENVTTTNTAPIISGTASGVSEVSVVVNAVTYTPAVSGGTWSQQLPTLAVNDYPVTVDATDDAGNTAVQAQATLSIVEAGSGFIVAKANASGNSLWGSIGMPEGALVSLVDDDSGAVTLNSGGNMECSKNASVATLDVDGTSVKVLVRPVGTPVKPFYKVNWQILD